jgi:hypothetical protein
MEYRPHILLAKLTPQLLTHLAEEGEFPFIQQTVAAINARTSQYRRVVLDKGARAALAL